MRCFVVTNFLNNHDKNYIVTNENCPSKETLISPIFVLKIITCLQSSIGILSFLLHFFMYLLNISLDN